MSLVCDRVELNEMTYVGRSFSIRYQPWHLIHNALTDVTYVTVCWSTIPCGVRWGTLSRRNHVHSCIKSPAQKDSRAYVYILPISTFQSDVSAISKSQASNERLWEGPCISPLIVVQGKQAWFELKLLYVGSCQRKVGFRVLILYKVDHWVIALTYRRVTR